MATVKSKDLGTKLLNELMVDIIGALIPGFLFIIVVFVSTIIPCLIYCEKSDMSQFAEFTSGGFWWVLLIICIIFSYVVGHIFYRADIAVPDKLDVDKQIKRFVDSIIKKQYDKKELQSLLRREIKILYERINDEQNKLSWSQWEYRGVKFSEHLSSACLNAMKRLDSEVDMPDKNDCDFLIILFPEDTISIKSEVTYAKLSQSSKDVIKEYEQYFDLSNVEIDPKLLYMYIFYCILHCQMDIGCAIPKRCEFPYTNYYKYLLKRNMGELLEHVNWFTIEDRSKNKINALKIQIQLFANEAYALINKNESHIRMSSSTWHITRLLILVTSISLFVFSVLAVYKLFFYHGEIKTTQCIAVLLPLAMFLLVLYIRNSILKYIHYQRMREIQYTLQIYHQFKEIIGFRRKYYSSHRTIIDEQNKEQ